MTIIIAISQGKGGSCKTTTAINLSGALNEQGIKTSIIDWDVAKPDAIKWQEQAQFINWVHLIDKDRATGQIDNIKQQNDVIIFDTPPNYEANALKAIAVSDFVIIPSTINFLDQQNAKNAAEIPLLLKKPFKILMSKIPLNTKDGKNAKFEVQDKAMCFKQIITDRNVVAQCPKYGQWIGQFSKNSDSHKQYLSLAQEVIAWCGIINKVNFTKVEEVNYES